MHNSKFAWAGIILLIMLVLQGCGRKGPLFMPKDTPPPPASYSELKK